MMHLIPQVKSLTLTEGVLSERAVRLVSEGVDPRVVRAIGRLPQSETGIPLTVTVSGDSGESYTLTVAADGIAITAPGPAGAFYAVQTLRQLFMAQEIPCVHIEDAPDLAHYDSLSELKLGNLFADEAVKFFD